jgi:hypothetical protein
MKGKMEGYGG